MPIFSSQLGKIESQNTEQSIKVMANHLRKIQEELEYRLMHLDSTNVSEIDASQTTIMTKDGELVKRLEDEIGNYNEMKASVEGFAAQIGSYEETVGGYTRQVADYKVAVDGYSVALQKYSEDVGGYTQQTAQYKATVEGYTATLAQYSETVSGYTQQTAQYKAAVEGYGVKLGEYTVAVNGYTQKDAEYTAAVNGYSVKLGEYTTAVEGYTQKEAEYIAAVNGYSVKVAEYAETVNGYTQQYSQWTQTAAGFEGRVVNLEKGQATMLKLAADGVTVTNALGNTVQITGSCIDFGSATDANTIEGKIAAATNKAASASSAASSAASAASSAGALAEAAYALAESVQIPSYIKSTYISKTEVRSPSIYGGMFYATGRGRLAEPAYYLYDSWTASNGLGNQVGYMSYDDNGAGTTEEAQKRVLLTSTNGTALKLQAAGNMSMEAGGKIYVMSPTVFSTNLILTRGVNYGSLRPTTGTPGQLYFEIA